LIRCRDKNKNMKNLLFAVRKILIKNKMKRFKNKKKNMLCFNIGLIIVIFLLLFIHLIGTNEASKEGFVIKELDSQLAGLKLVNKELNLQSAEMQSIERIKNEAISRLEMVESGGYDYVIFRSADSIVKK